MIRKMNKKLNRFNQNKKRKWSKIRFKMKNANLLNKIMKISPKMKILKLINKLGRVNIHKNMKTIQE